MKIFLWTFLVLFVLNYIVGFIALYNPKLDRYVNTDIEPVPWTTRINPVWWLMNGDSWTAPVINNGELYLPTIKNQFIRNVFWWFRNPIANFVGFVVGVDGLQYTAVGPTPVYLNSYRDAVPRRTGFKWAFLHYGILILPYVAYYNGTFEFYCGWRPTSGGLGTKIVYRSNG